MATDAAQVNAAEAQLETPSDSQDVPREEFAGAYVEKFWRQHILAAAVRAGVENRLLFPNPLLTSSLDPDAYLYHGSFIAFLAWDLQFGSLLKAAYGKPMPPCPNCETADRVQAKSWSHPRRVFDAGRTLFVSSRRYRCTRSGCPSFTGTDPRVLALMLKQHPVLLGPLRSYTAPYLLTHRAGVTTTVASLMRNDVVSTGSFSGTAHNIQHVHLEELAKSRAAYLAAHAKARSSQDLRSHLPGLVPAVPEPMQIPASHAPPDGPYYTDIFLNHPLFVQERLDLENLMRSRTGYFIKLDYCFKPCKRVRVTIGGKAYAATLVIVNEVMEVLGWYACQSTSLLDMEDELRALCDRLMKLNVPDEDGYTGVLAVYVDNYKSTAPLLRRIMKTDRPQGVIVCQDAFHSIRIVTDTCNSKHAKYTQFQQELSRAFVPLHPGDVLQVQAAHPGLCGAELSAKLNELCRKAIPPGAQHWPVLKAVMDKWAKEGPDSDGNDLFGPDTMAVFLDQQEMVLENALTDPLPVERMYTKDAAGKQRAKRGTSDVENTNLHINGVLSTAPGHSCQLAHELFTHALGRRNIRMALSFGSFKVPDNYDLRSLLEDHKKQLALGMQPLLDPASARYLEFLDWPADRLSCERFGFAAGFPITQHSEPTAQFIQEDAAELAEGEAAAWAASAERRALEVQQIADPPVPAWSASAASPGAERTASGGSLAIIPHSQSPSGAAQVSAAEPQQAASLAPPSVPHTDAAAAFAVAVAAAAAFSSYATTPSHVPGDGAAQVAPAVELLQPPSCTGLSTQPVGIPSIAEAACSSASAQDPSSGLFQLAAAVAPATTASASAAAAFAATTQPTACDGPPGSQAIAYHQLSPRGAPGHSQPARHAAAPTPTAAPGTITAAGSQGFSHHHHHHAPQGAPNMVATLSSQHQPGFLSPAGAPLAAQVTTPELFGALDSREAAAWVQLHRELQQLLAVQETGDARIAAGRRIAKALLAVQEFGFCMQYKQLLQRLLQHFKATVNVGLPGLATAAVLQQPAAGAPSSRDATPPPATLQPVAAPIAGGVAAAAGGMAASSSSTAPTQQGQRQLVRPTIQQVLLLNRMRCSKRRSTVADSIRPITTTHQKLLFFVLLEKLGCEDWHEVEEWWNLLCQPDVPFIHRRHLEQYHTRLMTEHLALLSTSSPGNPTRPRNLAGARVPVVSHLEAECFCELMHTFGKHSWAAMAAFWNVFVADVHGALFKHHALPVPIHYKSAEQLQQFYQQATTLLHSPGIGSAASVPQVPRPSTAALPRGQLTMQASMQRAASQAAAAAAASSSRAAAAADQGATPSSSNAGSAPAAVGQKRSRSPAAEKERKQPGPKVGSHNQKEKSCNLCRLVNNHPQDFRGLDVIHPHQNCPNLDRACKACRKQYRKWVLLETCEEHKGGDEGAGAAATEAASK